MAILGNIIKGGNYLKELLLREKKGPFGENKEVLQNLLDRLKTPIW